jgi:transposase
MMLPQVSAAVRVFLCTRPTDMRKSFDALSGLVQECFGQDPLAGHLFLFLNRRRDRIKILHFDRDGLVIWYKRLEAGTFQQLDPKAHAPRASGSAGIELTVTDLTLLLTGIDLATARRRKRYSRAG